MNKTAATFLILAFILMGVYACKDDDTIGDPEEVSYDAITAKFGATIDINNLPNYATQSIPAYITKDNTAGNEITDKGATLGRVLFYDKMLSVDNTVACATCHKQELAFSDADAASTGVNGTTGRHSMRLINTRFADEERFFWDERAATLEEQTTQPIQDHAEMGYSGNDGDPTLDDLILKLKAIDYYPEFFTYIYGDSEITEERIQNSLAQFIRSIQSFDSKYDEGRAAAPNNGSNFTNFTAAENAGKELFMAPPVFDNTGNRTSGGVGCNGCHRAPEFDIAPNSRNNGIIGTIGGGTDLSNTRSPTLRDVVNAAGSVNGLLMHNARFGALQGVLVHYNSIVDNQSLDNRLKPNGSPQRLNLTPSERQELVAFLGTLTGSDVYTNEKWSNPFE
ncbi:cytochrome-c peroxidase [Bacteroidia bacterium]|nr:cytochrome-c peroxidase [Bacteroidia bacterium]MDB9882516.1 cytochrome-c peroxidase [Bacteroidia bacterium]